mmetsp:Transcript_91696/g.159049  ORF Transcript_91696/g.159049 Transcript_91696/m.159049 type:complete len:80 (+) Transcript_91696:1332-1571(+)
MAQKRTKAHEKADDLPDKMASRVLEFWCFGGLCRFDIKIALGLQFLFMFLRSQLQTERLCCCIIFLMLIASRSDVGLVQ